MTGHDLTLGAMPQGGGRWRSLVWAPLAQRVEICVGDRRWALHPTGDGYHSLDRKSVV